MLTRNFTSAKVAGRAIPLRLTSLICSRSMRMANQKKASVLCRFTRKQVDYLKTELSILFFRYYVCTAPKAGGSCREIAAAELNRARDQGLEKSKSELDYGFWMKSQTSPSRGCPHGLWKCSCPFITRIDAGCARPSSKRRCQFHSE